MRAFLFLLSVVVVTACTSGGAVRDRAPAAPVVKLIHPLGSHDISSPFGPRGSRMHYGLDLRAPIGTPVKAAAPGKIIAATTMRGFGKIVVVDHGNGLETWYAHLSEIAVRRDQHILVGARIGDVGMTGNATGPHLHFEVRKWGKPVDPLPLLEEGARHQVTGRVGS